MINYSRIIKTYNRSFFLLGPRGTGKSTFIHQKFKTAKIVDLLDEATYQRLLIKPEALASELEMVKQGSWVVLDEVQRLPILLNTVHSSIERQKLKFVLCGSSARKLKKDNVNLLGGRASESLTFPLVPKEYKQDFDLDKSLQYGDLPLIVSDPDPLEALKAYVRVYLKEEIQAEALVRNLASFARFLQVASLMNGQVISRSNVARDAGVKRPTVDGYFSILVDTLIGFFLPAFEGRLRIKEKRHPKFYLFDCGVARALKENFGPISYEERGGLLETWFANYLRAMNAYEERFDSMYYWAASETKAEVDFLLRRGNEFIAIELKSTETIRPEHFAGLKAIKGLKGLKKQFLVYLGQSASIIDRIYCLPLKEFIKEFDEKCLF